MLHAIRTAFTAVVLVAVTTIAAQTQNHAPNPYRTVEGWGELPPGREWGSTSAIFPSPGGNIWVAERCGQNTCVGRDDVDPILLFDTSGKLLRSFGAGMIVWPHGIFVDSNGNVWVADARGDGDRGHQIHKFSPQGNLLMSLGTAGVAAQGETTFNQPSNVLVAPGGDIFVVDGHGAGGNNRVVKFSSDGSFITEWGGTGGEDGEFRDPHALAMDSQGRLFVGDRANKRIQIFDQDGNHISTWSQFSRPSGLFIDKNDILYSADSESNNTWGANPGWKRGIRIGSAIDGFVTAFIPDPEPDPDNAGTTAAEGVMADENGNVYGAEVGPQGIKKYLPR